MSLLLSKAGGAKMVINMISEKIEYKLLCLLVDVSNEQTPKALEILKEIEFHGKLNIVLKVEFIKKLKERINTIMCNDTIKQESDIAFSDYTELDKLYKEIKRK